MTGPRALEGRGTRLISIPSTLWNPLSGPAPRQGAFGWYRPSGGFTTTLMSDVPSGTDAASVQTFRDVYPLTLIAGLIHWKMPLMRLRACERAKLKCDGPDWPRHRARRMSKPSYFGERRVADPTFSHLLRPGLRTAKAFGPVLQTSNFAVAHHAFTGAALTAGSPFLRGCRREAPPFEPPATRRRRR
jgi:hypothetical protein